MREAPLMEHLEELRSRLIRALLAWAVGTGLAWNYAQDILGILERPLLPYANRLDKTAGELLVYQTITEPFTTVLSIAAVGGLLLALPIIAYQIWAFIAPGLYGHERRLAGPFLLGVGFSFAVGAAFAYYVILPFAVPFLLGFLGQAATPVLSIGRYIGQILTFMGVMGVMFEMPIVSYLLARLGMLTSQFLAQNWRIAVVLMLAIAAIITPTVDVINLSIVAGPLFFLYWIAVLTARLGERGRLLAERQAMAQPSSGS